MKGEPPAPQLSTEIGTTLNLFSGIEERYLEGWAEFSLHINNTVGAGVNAGVRMRNPPKSNTVAVFERISFFPSIADNAMIMNHGAQLADLGNIVSGVQGLLDRRGSPSQLIESISTIGAPGFGNTRWLGAQGANQTNPEQMIMTQNQEIPLFPGDAIQINSTVQLLSIDVNLKWRERLLEESEIF